MIQGRRILVFTGDGKGKTTAALGMALRASGHDLNVGIVQFIKSREDVGEAKALMNIQGIDLFIAGLGFLPSENQSEFALHCQAAAEALQAARRLLQSKKYDLIILDEACFALHKRLFTEPELLDLCSYMKENSALVFTGRHATPGLIKIADTVTEMKVIKHGYDHGISAQDGIEK